MKLKTLMILLITFSILAVVLLLTSRPKKTEGPPIMGSLLFDGLAAGEIAAITITSPEAAARLRQTPGGWTVENRFDHPADFSKIADLVQKLSGAKIGRTFPITPEIQARLSLYSPGQPDLPANQKGTRVVLTDKEATPLADLIIGRPREDGHGSAADTCYVLRPSQKQAYLIDRSFRFLEKKPAGWLSNKPIDLNPKQIWKVECFDTRKGVSIYTLARPAEDKEPVLSDLPPGKKMTSFKADQVFEALTSFTVADVADRSQKDDDARFSSAPRFDYYLYDGTVYHAFPGAVLKNGSENHYFRAEVSYHPPPAKEKSLPTENQNKVAKEAARLNLQISPWIYIISKWVYDSFITDPQSLIEKIEKEEKN